MSINEELSPQAKPRPSPLDFRNTDLVSRLLAATPPYLYNMPIIPNTFFFSEMLRSFVQAKSETSGRMSNSFHSRRTRKRSWTQSRAEYYQREAQKSDTNMNNWSPYDVKSLETNLVKGASNTNVRIPETNEPKVSATVTSSQSNYLNEKQEFHNVSQQNHVPMFQPFPPNVSHEQNQAGLMLPPPPPVWYPPIYPPPYGLDPLHFFIDLRVSGHIYDRKGKDTAHTLDVDHHDVPAAQGSAVDVSGDSMNKVQISDQHFKLSGHKSAFNVPTTNLTKNLPINLSNNKAFSGELKETKAKFDVKSMGFEKTSNKTSTSYVMSNINKIYKFLREDLYKIDTSDEKPTAGRAEQTVEVSDEANVETEEEKQKRVKDLRALIGLELVVDYMNHAKPRNAERGSNHSENSSTDMESSSSPSVEVVACTEELSQGI